MVVFSRPLDRLTAAATAPPVSPLAPHSALLPIGYPMDRFGAVRLALTDVVDEASNLTYGHLTARPAVTQRFVLSSNSWPCGHLWAGPTPPNPTHLFSRGTNIWPGGQLPCAAAGVETKFAATNIAANIRPAPRRKPNAAVFLPMALTPF